MINAIGSSTFASPADAGKSASGLEAQLERYQQELANCVSCSSSKTVEGKQNIQLISDKISALKAQIEERTSAKLTTQKATVQKLNEQSATPNIRPQGNSNSSNDAIVSGAVNNTVPATGSTTDTVGTRLNVFA